ncbi:MAG: hypothetical protein JO345_28145 [Streptosporangiaceae bacterium]|nr:hypothetical protein [Streptosporangiaceae bacterium]
MSLDPDKSPANAMDGAIVALRARFRSGEPLLSACSADLRRWSSGFAWFRDLRQRGACPDISGFVQIARPTWADGVEEGPTMADGVEEGADLGGRGRKRWPTMADGVEEGPTMADGVEEKGLVET